MSSAPQLPDDLRQALEEAVRVIVETARPELVILFGSWAEGKAREDSDVDLLVVADTDDRLELSAQLREALRPILGERGLDLLLRTPEHWRESRRIIGFVSHEADRYGVRLYERAA